MSIHSRNWTNNTTLIIVPNLRLVTPDNTTTVIDYVNNYPPSSLNSNHWLSSNKIGVVVDENLKVMNTNNLVSSVSP